MAPLARRKASIACGSVAVSHSFSVTPQLLAKQEAQHEALENINDPLNG